MCIALVVRPAALDSDTVSFSQLTRALVPVLSEGTWDQIQEDHQRVGLQWRDDLEPGWGKPKYVTKVLADLSEERLVEVAERCLELLDDRSTLALQDALWLIEADGEVKISGVTRDSLASGLDGRIMDPQRSAGDFLKRFAEGDPPETFYAESGRLLTYGYSFDAIFSATTSDQREHGKSFSHRELLGHFGFWEWPDKRVYQFLEALVHPRVRVGKDQSAWTTWINDILAPDRLWLAEADQVSGHPIYAIEQRHPGVFGRPKNLVFASTGPKPEIGFRDAVNNDIVILKHSEHCLVFDDRIPEGGLTWAELVSWFGSLTTEVEFSSSEVRARLGERLLRSLGSPVERYLFEAYFRTQASKLRDRLPALLPQVYLHYDPVAARELRARGEERRFLAQRMDFLMLLPNRVRVVLEVDGQQHYSTGVGIDAKPSPRTYATTVMADRALRLAGYEVYRFSGYELSSRARATRTAESFFESLFRRHSFP